MSLLDQFLARSDIVSDGSTLQYAISFSGSKPSSTELPYLDRSHIHAYSVVPATALTGEVITPISFRWIDDYWIELIEAVTEDNVIRIQRETFDHYNLTDYNDVAQITENDLELSQRQLLFIAQETADLAKATALLVASGNSTEITITAGNSLQFYKDATPLGSASETRKVVLTGDNIVASVPFTDTVSYQINSGCVSVVLATPPVGGAVTGVTKADEVHINALSLVGDTLTIKLSAITSAASAKPNVLVDNVPVTMANVNTTLSYWEGTIEIAVLASKTVQITEDNSITKQLVITKVAAPIISNLYFLNAYPEASQTEHAQGQEVSVSVSADVPFNKVTILAGSAVVAGDYPVPLGTTAVFEAVVAPSNAYVTTKAVSAYVTTVDNAVSITKASTDFGATDGTHTLKCNDIVPTVSLATPVYSNGYSALKDTETADVVPTFGNYSDVLWATIGTELSLDDSATTAGAMTVSRVNGTYNVTTANLSVTAYRRTNATSTTATKIVQIAHTAVTLAATYPSARLRSGVTPQPHTVSIVPSQLLYSTPTFTASIGTAGSTTGSGLAYNVPIVIADSDSKGTGTLTCNAVNLAGKVTTTLATGATYTAGGFVARSAYVAAFSKEVAIGTNVSDTSKLIATINGLTGSYVAATGTFVRDPLSTVTEYTICSPTNVANAAGNLLHMNELALTNSNTTGSMSITIEEAV